MQQANNTKHTKLHPHVNFSSYVIVARVLSHKNLIILQPFSRQFKSLYKISKKNELNCAEIQETADLSG